MGSHIRRLGTAAVIAGSLFSSSNYAQQPANFYTGKTIKFLIGFSPGGGYDAYARVVAHFLRNHIPGDPIIVVEYMPGGGGRIVSRYVYHKAPRDGTVIATADQSLVFQQALGDRSLQFDAEKFNWIGNVDADNNIVFTWYKSGVKNLADAQEVSVTLAATSANTTSEAYPKVLNAILGTKFRIVRGYAGGNTANLAMESGEVAGRGASSWANFKISKPDWIRDGKINVLVQVGLRKAPDLPQVPLLLDVAANDIDRAALRLLAQPIEIGHSLFTAPGVPADRMAALRKSFDETMRDPDFLKQAESMKVDVNPVSGDEVQKTVAEIVATPKAAVARLTSIIGASGL